MVANTRGAPSDAPVGPRSRQARVLIVDDDARVASLCERALTVRGHEVMVAISLGAAHDLLDRGVPFDAWLLDLNLHEPNDGLRLIERARALDPAPLVLVMSGSTRLKDAFAVGRSGAYDFLTKPIDFDEVSERFANRPKLPPVRRRSGVRFRPGPVIVSDAMRRVMEKAERVAATPSSSVLILGESGSGKEIVAAHIHERSSRQQKPFVRVNLAAFPDSMVDAELFGSVRGAFTDATRDRAGLIASADEGTLLLDELCEFRIDLQPKLLRVLEDRRFFPVGSDKERRVDVRVLAATNRDPHEAIESGILRADLFYRLSAGILHVPPLRERRDDIVPLMIYFLAELANEAGTSPPGLSRAVTDELLEYAWPGNVRELRNVATRVSMLAHDGEVTSEMLGLESASRPKAHVPLPVSRQMPAVRSATDVTSTLGDARDEAVASIEKSQIEQTLAACGGSRSEAARRLGVSRSTLWLRMKRYGIE